MIPSFIKTILKQWRILYKDLWKDGIESGENLGKKLAGEKDVKEKKETEIKRE